MQKAAMGVECNGEYIGPQDPRQLVLQSQPAPATAGPPRAEHSSRGLALRALLRTLSSLARCLTTPLPGSISRSTSALVIAATL